MAKENIMKEVKIEKCPFCGGEEMIQTRVASYGGAYLTPANNSWRSAALFATVCRDCGSVVRTYCQDPEKLFPKKERRR